ncbi:DHA2 family lincomycin resistance protein-like MFS transporter [Psychromicrobium silvestre]|uniref:DHA2 family lincomycin resistance protein-like MFS transporter n=1 Tax=Psychromicrobium silvestre TaxID=1645614 RepID=A0A7Y9LRN7_9MICC|nr:MDR family MFS transporter [Psychromicrobium silvestre]NYE94344.1 DHA2 family lincomycin resistance protein-like MFS transporter [Psychromicrobium silvestre]
MTETQSHPPSPDLERRNMQVIYLLLAATFVVFLNETIMSVALTPLMNDLHVDANTVQWLSTAFMLTMAVVIPITGFLLQRLTTRQVFITAMIFFSAGTLLAIVAPGFSVLLIARIVQACGTAIMMPLLMTTILQLVPASSRGKTMGNISIVISVAPAIGPTIAGIILSLGSWRWMFGVVLPIALVMLAIGYRWVRNVSEPSKAPLDVASVILSAFGFSGLVYGLSQLGHTGTDASPGVLVVSLVVGVVALTAFIFRQLSLQRSDRALLDLRTFRNSSFTATVVMMLVAMMALFGTIILLPIYLQRVLHVESLWVGLMLLPGGLVMGLSAPIAGRLFDKYGPRPLIVPGTILVTAVLWMLSMVNANTSPYYLLVMHILLSLGLGFVFTPLFTAGLASLEPKLYSHGSAIVGTVQQVAGAAGTALFIAVMSSQAAGLAATGSSDEVATAAGIRLAFMIGAILFTANIVIGFFIRKPADSVTSEAHEGVEAPAH